MANPFNSGLKQSANSATAPRNAVNDPKARPRRTHNTFNRTYHHYCTQRYGDIHPFYVDEMVPGDKNPLYSEHELKTYTLKSPLMTGLSMKKGYFAVPYKCLLPLHYDKIFVNPKFGDDIPAHANTFINLEYSPFNEILNRIRDFNGTFETLPNILHDIFFLEWFFSNGSLLNAMGYKLNSVFPKIDKLSFDSWVDSFFTELFSHTIVFEFIDEESTTLYGFKPSDGDDFSDPSIISVTSHRLLELLRGPFAFSLYQYGSETQLPDDTFFDNIKEILRKVGGQNLFTFDTRPLNYSRLLAYQISSQVFFSNDDIDHIYTANLYRQNMLSLFLYSGNNVQYFSYNGIRMEFDILSGIHVRTVLFTYFRQFDLEAYRFLYNIFSFRKSLRFADYYLGSRLNPLALGDINAPVINDNVSAIDMTRSISIQRFTNFVNKIPSQLSQYLKEMFGVNPAPDITEPSYLGVTQHNIGGFIVENNAEEQGKLVTNLVSDDGKFAFEVDIDDPCIIIGLSWFEQPRVYASIIERNMLHEDRFDDFQPMLQYVGDQEIKACEFNSSLPFSEPWAYTLRNMEYKQRVHQATGGFVENLPSWANVVDNPSNLQEFESDYDHLNSNLIRSRNYEFDKYYSSLSGYSLASYFHFIIKYINKNEITRPMAVAPEILG